MEATGEEALRLLKEPKAESLAALRVLKVFKAGLSELPESIGLCQQLVQLDLGGNALSSFAAIPALPQLEILFASDTGLAQLPDLSACPRLRMLGVKDNRLTALDGDLLPITLEWLIAAGNQISELPNLGRLGKVRKLMLSHNRLSCAALAPVARIEALEMLRVAANCLEAFPEELLSHRRLAWVAVGGNPFAEEALGRTLATGAAASLDFSEVTLGPKLGSGAGATVYQGTWDQRSVAVKIWDAERFSDGTALTEWGANRVASSPGHEALVAVLGTFEEPRGMVLELLPEAKAAGRPPSFASVTRDAAPVAGDPRWTPGAAKRIAGRVAQAAEYLHGKGLMHGDIYLHNTLVICTPGAGDGGTEVADCRLSDFGAAAAVDSEQLRRLEVRAFGWLLQDLVESGGEGAEMELLKELRARCGAADPLQLPSFAELAKLLA
ncbi:unnamed protein product [Effrenium voratum]|uniref:Protein kinase domain-containing protein n=1 Tax=Effrenium voratum TaxID=2562239 RepID=A0AA36MJW8_9DINO|nr:unnamed protein product [Effrenium voratum]